MPDFPVICAWALEAGERHPDGTKISVALVNAVDLKDRDPISLRVAGGPVILHVTVDPVTLQYVAKTKDRTVPVELADLLKGLADGSYQPFTSPNGEVW